MAPGAISTPAMTGEGAGEELSDVEKYIAGKAPQELTFDIKQFGYDLFLARPSALAQRATLGQPSIPGQPPTLGQLPVLPQVPNVPVGPGYVTGPGDEVRVNVWGSIEGTWNVTVDRDGNITIPKIGTLGVAGLTFEDLKETIFKEFSKSYTDFEMNVSMGNLRSITIYVVGNARRPGAYSISSLSSLINVLFESSGPSKVGTMRDLQVKRNGDTLTHFDLYDFLLKGQKGDDLRLMQEDVIFIPPIGPIAGIAGNVKTPAIYELKGRTRVSELIKMAGGVTAKAYLQRVQIERVFENRSKIVLDLNFQQLKDKNDVFLENGDLVKIFPIIASVTNKVVLRGNVLRPGEYEWTSDMKVRDLIKSTNDLLPDTLLDTARIDRLVPPDFHQEYRIVNLGKLLLENDEKENIRLEPYDTVVVLNKWEVQPKEKVRTEGALNKPGVYEFRPNMKLSELIKLSGGLKKYAMVESAELTRVTATPEGPKTEKLIVHPRDALQEDAVYDIPLQEDDYLFIRSVPEWDLYKLVTIMGEVKYPGNHSLEKGEKLSSVLVRAGGFTDKAYLRGAVFTRESIRKSQQIQVKEMVDRLERELMATGVAEVGTAVDAEQAQIQVQENRQKALFIQSLRAIEPKGRMVISLDFPEKLRNSAEDFDLEEGDVLFVPPLLQNVQVVGAVYNQTSFKYKDGRDYSYYIDMSGGYTKNADKGSLYILKVDGRATRPKNALFWSGPSRRWEHGYAQLEPGDAIIVPDKLEKTPWMRNIKDITQIVANIASSAGIAMIGLTRP
jgi:protein involved in polysaccharide export with SLBB domain